MKQNALAQAVSGQILGHLAEVVVEAFLIAALFLNFGGMIAMLIAGFGSKTAIKEEKLGEAFDEVD